MYSETNWMNLVKEVSAVIGPITGNVFSEKQYPMVESRLKRRCSELKLTSAAEYERYWKSHQKEENEVLIGLLTTHFTSFFREFIHFEWLAHELPFLVEEALRDNRKTLRFWSAACSRGHEVWSLCMFLDYELKRIKAPVDFVVYGSDIDEVSIQEGQNAVYHRRDIETAPRHYWENHCVRGKDEISDWYKIKSSLREKAKFFKMNLLKLDIPANEKFDVILIRNVLIYFEKDNQLKIAEALLSHLYPQGTLITGVSESLSGLLPDIKTAGPSIYKKITSQVVKKEAQKMKVFCIDDSPTVLTILKKILSNSEFEVMDTASNGEEAIEKLKTLKPDVITLDLHMPLMDGPTFLARTGMAKKLPVVIVSSVDREDPIISKLNDSGVADIVEKPTLTNMSLIGDELIQKLKIGYKVMQTGVLKGALNQGLGTKKRGPVVVMMNYGPGDERKVDSVLSEIKPHNDHVVRIVNGEGVSSGTRKSLPSLPVVWLHFNHGSLSEIKRHRQDTDYILIEENSGPSDLNGDDISPYTSFAYLIDKIVAGE